MNWNPPDDWTEVSEDVFGDLLDEFDYRREAWMNITSYLEHPSRKLFAYVVNETATHPAKYFIQPQLVQS